MLVFFCVCKNLLSRLFFANNQNDLFSQKSIYLCLRLDIKNSKIILSTFLHDFENAVKNFILFSLELVFCDIKYSPHDLPNVREAAQTSCFCGKYNVK